MKQVFRIIVLVFAGAVVIISTGSEGVAISSQPVVSTMAGEKMTHGSTDGTGAAARFNFTTGTATDGANLYVLDSYSHTIRKMIISSGEVTTFAGTAGISGSNDGTGTATRFNTPQGVTTDGNNLYVTDTLNCTIRKIRIATGEVTTLAGAAGVFGSTDGVGPAARFAAPYGITNDGSNLYVTDTYNGTIRKVVISTGEVTTLAGTANSFGFADGMGITAQFNFLSGITSVGANLYVVDSGSNIIRKINKQSGAVTTIAGVAGLSGSTDGIGTSALFSSPQSIVGDGTSLYVADSVNAVIRKIDLSTKNVSTLAGAANIFDSIDGNAASARFLSPNGITANATNIFVTDMGIIRKIE
jgi:sugar lactone lactonase YvrE